MLTNTDGNASRISQQYIYMYIYTVRIYKYTHIEYIDILLLKWIKQLTRLERLEKDDFCIYKQARVFIVTGKNITIANVLTDNVTFYYFYYIVNSMPILATSIWHKKWYPSNGRQTDLHVLYVTGTLWSS